MAAECVQDLILVNRQPEPSIWGSTHRKRAWTYQEMIFSRRCLVFSEDSIWYWSKSGIYEEDIVGHS